MAKNLIGDQAAQESYLEFLPKLREAFWHQFGYRLREELRAELQQEAESLGWKRWLSVIAAGRDPSGFPWLMAKRVVQAVRVGVRLCGNERLREPLARAVIHPELRQLERVGLVEELHLDERDDPAEIAEVKIDFHEFRCRQSAQRRRILRMLFAGHGTKYISGRLGLSQSAITRHRRLLHDQFRDRAGVG